MHHVAIMKKSWRFVPQVLARRKTIESRWYQHRAGAWEKVHKGDTVFFKTTGEPVTAKAVVASVLSFDELTPAEVKMILRKYGRADGIAAPEIPRYYRLFKDKRYCVLVFLKNAQAVKPFAINKKGFGAMSAWLTVKNIKEIKRP